MPAYKASRIRPTPSKMLAPPGTPAVAVMPAQLAGIASDLNNAPHSRYLAAMRDSLMARPMASTLSPALGAGGPVASTGIVQRDGYDADDESDGDRRRLTPQERAFLRRIPRGVTRTDALMDVAIGSYGAGSGRAKAHRGQQDQLLPAGSGMMGQSPVTTLDHLLGAQPKKSASAHISFTNVKRARALRDYSQAEKNSASSVPAPVARLKARKLAKAILRGKADVRSSDLMTTEHIERQVELDPGTRANKDRAIGYALRDAEVHSIGPVSSRFVNYSDRPEPEPASDPDSDSVSDVTTDYDEV